MMKWRWGMLIGVVVGVLALGLDVWFTPRAQAQSVDACADVRFLMANNLTPTQLLVGGGTLGANQATSGQIASGDSGDVWVFSVTGATNSTTASFSFAPPADVPLEFAVFRGMEILSGDGYQPIVVGENYSVPTTRDGVYTLVVQMASLAQQATLSAPASYSVTANFPSAGDPAAGLTKFRDAGTNQEYAINQGYVLNEGQQVVSLANGVDIRVNANSLSGVASQNRIQAIFAPSGSLLLNTWARQVSYVGGNASIVGDTRLFFLESFGFAEQIVNQGELNNITDANDTNFVTDWAGIYGVWMLRDCLGIKLNDGRTLTLAIDPTQVQRALTAVGQAPVATYGCGAFYVRANALDLAQASTRHELCMNVGDGVSSGILAGTETRLNQSVLTMQLVGQRQLTLTSTRFTLTPRTQASASDAPPYDITLAAFDDPNASTSISLDWLNLQSFALTPEAVTLGFTDAPRTSTSRPSGQLASLTALDDVVHIVYRGTDAQERLLLPINESYFEMVAPAGQPTFDGAPFDGRALPDQAGYQPRALNNTGGECYPVNTVDLGVNCAPNGDINPANGNLWYSVTDLSAHHPVMDLTLSRSYNSMNYLQDSAFGRGWSFNYPIDYTVPFDPALSARPVDLSLTGEGRISYRVALDLTWTPRGIINLTTASGSRHSFVRQTRPDFVGEIYTALTMPNWTLSRAGADPNQIVRSEWRLSQDNGLSYRFDRAGRLRAFGYAEQGHEVTIDYPWRDVNGLADQTVTITDSAQDRAITLDYSAEGYITRAELRDLTQSAAGDACNAEDGCFEVSYSYTNGLLTSVSYPSGLTARYEYDELGRLIRHDDPFAPIAPRMEYLYGAGGDVLQAFILSPEEASASDASRVWRLLTTSATADQKTVTVLDYLGNQRTYVYALSAGDVRRVGESYTLLSQSSPLAAAGDVDARPQEYAWTEGLLSEFRARLIPNQSQRGRNTISVQYSAGRLAGVRGGVPDTQFLTGNPPAADGTPSALFLPQNIGLADGSRLNFTYQGGLIASFSDENGATYVLERDEQGRVLRLIRQVDNLIWTYEYQNALNLPSRITQSNGTPEDSGYAVSYTWDGLGRLLSVSDTEGTTSIEYSPLTLVAEQYMQSMLITAPNGVQTWLRFDLLGRLKERTIFATAEQGTTGVFERATTYDYFAAHEDPLRRLAKVNEWLRDEATGEVRPLSTTYRIEAFTSFNDGTLIAGESISMTDPYGRTTTRVYDALGRLRGAGDPFTQFSRYDYTSVDTANPAPETSPNANGLTIIETESLGSEVVARVRYVFNNSWQLTGVERTSFQDQTPTGTTTWRFFPAPTGTQYRLYQTTGTGLRNVYWWDRNNTNTSNYQAGRATAIEVERDSTALGANVRPNLRASYDGLGRVASLTQTVGGQSEVINMAYCPLAQGGLKIVRSAVNQAADCAEAGALSLSYDAQGRLVRIEQDDTTRTLSYRSETGGYAVTLNASNTLTLTSATWELRYNALGELIQWLDDAGNQRDYRYDTLGRLLAVDVLGVPEASYRYAYNDAHLLTSQTDGLGRGEVYAYDERGQLTAAQNISTGDLTTYTYDTRGLLTSTISPLGAVTTYEYSDPADPRRVTAIISPTGRDSFTWNDAQNSLTYTDARGKSTSYRYDGLGLLWNMQAPSGREYGLDWDEAGRLSRFSLSEGAAQRQMTLAYDSANQSLSVGAQGVAEWQWRLFYNDAGRLTALLNPAEQALAFGYDGLGQLEAIVSTGEDEAAWTYERSDASNEILAVDANGNEILLTYDALYRLVSRQAGDAQTRYQYAPSALSDGTLNLRVESGDGVRYYSFSAGAARTAPQISYHAQGQRVLYVYDVEGKLVRLSREVCLNTPLDDSTPTYTDLAQIEVTEFSSETPVCDASLTSANVWRQVVEFRYDPNGRPIRVVDVEQDVEAYAYDPVGNLVNYQNVDGKTFVYLYDDLNRLERVRTPKGIDLMVRYELDQVSGVCQALSEANLNYADCAAQGGTLEEYAYDGAGRLIAVRFPNQDQTSERPLSYAGAGAGAVTQLGGASFSYSADGLAQLVGRDDYDLGYSGVGQLGRVDGDGALSFAYDSQGRLTRAVQGRQTIAIDYLAEGRGFSLSDASTSERLTVRLAGNGLLESIDASGDEAVPSLRVVNYSQDELGNLLFTLEWQDGATTDFLVNRRNQALDILYLPSFDATSLLDPQFTYDLSSSGRVRKLIISSASAPQLFANQASGYIVVVGYDQDDKPVTMRVNDELSNRLLYQVTMVYGDFGQLSREVRAYEDGTQVSLDYAYSPRNQLSARTVTLSSQGVIQAQSRFTYAYDAAGNLISVASATGDQCASYSYDALNRLRNAQSPSANLNFVYDGYDRLVEAGSLRFAYVGDSATPLRVSQGNESALVANHSAGAPLFSASQGQAARLFYGGQGQIFGADSENQASLWLIDPLGRPLDLTPPVANVDDPCGLGQLRRTDLPPLLLGDLLWEGNSGLYFSQGRAYSPDAARFLQRDPRGVDAFGNVYDYPARQTALPVALARADYRQGLQRLSQALSDAQRSQHLTAQSILTQYAPAPLGEVQDPFLLSVGISSQDLRQRLAQGIDLPDWLLRNYNLPAPSYDPRTGALSFALANAPAQGGTGSARSLNLGASHWQGRLDWTPESAPNSVAHLQRLSAWLTTPRTPTQYLSGAWQRPALSLSEAWSAQVVPDFSTASTPSAVLAFLPRALNPDWQSESLLTVLAHLQDAPTWRSVDFFQRLNQAALPTLPAVPPSDLSAWRETWFSQDVFGIEALLSEAGRLPAVPAPSLSLGGGQ